MDGNEEERIGRNQDRGASKNRTKQSGEERFKEEAFEYNQGEYECQPEVARNKDAGDEGGCVNNHEDNDFGSLGTQVPLDTRSPRH